MRPQGEELSLSELRDRVMDIASSKGEASEKDDLISLIRVVMERRPDDAEAQFSFGFSIYHLRRNATADLLTEALEALRWAQIMDPHDQWARLYEIYVLWESNNFHACAAACALLDRSAFRSSQDHAWRAISVDEIEFSALAELGIGSERAGLLAKEIVQATELEGSGFFPFVPSLFLRSIDLAVRCALLTLDEAVSYRKRLDCSSE